MASETAINSNLNDFSVTLDRRSFVPYYEQITIQLRNAILANRANAGQEFWSERELANKLGISKPPVKRAYERLRAEGLLQISKGKRPVMWTGGFSWHIQDLWSFTEEIRARGQTPTTKLLAINLLNPDSEVAECLNLHPNDQVYGVQRLRFVQGEPVGVETAYLPAKIYPDLEKQDFEQLSLYHIIEAVYGHKLERGDVRIGALSAGYEEVRLLKVEVGFPLVRVQRVVFDVGGTPLECGLAMFRADSYVARITSFRRPADNSFTANRDMG